MNRIKTIRMVFASLFFALLFIFSNVNADIYSDMEDRISQNNKIMRYANNMNSIFRSSYLDLSMKELSETNYAGLGAWQQEKIKATAKNILGDSTSLKSSEKLEKFYNWIVENYYFYETPEKISSLSIDNRYNNPYYLLAYEYDNYGKVRANANGYAATLIAFARTEGIPTRIVAGYYNSSVRDNYSEWGFAVDDSQINHVWVEAYVDGVWKMFDPVADSYKKYDDETSEYVDTLDKQVPVEENKEENVDNNDSESTVENTENISNETLHENIFFGPTMEELSKTHVAFRTYSGNRNIEYLDNYSEREALTNFLNIKTNGSTNGKKINSSYNVNNSSTWVDKSDTSSVTNGYGRLRRMYLPFKKGIAGNLKLTSFTALENLLVSDNKLNTVYITGARSLKTLNVSNNNITKLIVRGSKKLVTLRANSNPLTYAEYDFYKGQSKAIIKAGYGGTISVRYIKGESGRRHYFMANPKKGYHFIGWYSGSKRVYRSAKFELSKNGSFTYVAKFEKNPPAPYIKISISKQKLWYFKNGKAIYSSSVVTGQRNRHDTRKGTYSLRGKAKNVYLVGLDYKSFVNYWMPIYADVGLHDATWRWSFGGSIYRYNGSHGCVNLPLRTAKYIYNNVPIRTTVKIVD